MSTKHPIIVKRLLIRPQGNLSNNLKHKLIKIASTNKPIFREDVIFESKDEAFITGEYRSVKIVNKLNILTNQCHTIAKCVTLMGDTVEKTSDCVSLLIGQENYNTLFYALCSVINHEYKIKGILALLKPKPKPVNNKPTVQQQFTDKYCQTTESRLEFRIRPPRRRAKKVVVPYVVKPVDTKRIPIQNYSDNLIRKVIDIKPEGDIKLEIKSADDIKKEKLDVPEQAVPNKDTDLIQSDCILPDLGFLHDDNSNYSTKSAFTIKTTPEILLDPLKLLIDRHTNDNFIPANCPIKLMDKSILYLPFKPEDDFHIATKENLENLNPADRNKLLMHQMQIDFNRCLSLTDDEVKLPIHVAVMNDDLELLKRQCVVLKMWGESVDVPAHNQMTALRLSLYRESAAATGILLANGADPLLADDSHSTCVHHAAELKTDHLDVALHHCRTNARKVIHEHIEELQKPNWEMQSDEDLGTTLLNYICCTLFDKQGYTPLMLASKLGLYENVRLLLECAPASVNLQMPNSGNTALFLAVAAACTLAAELGDKSKVVDYFRKTIEYLLDASADPYIDNNSSTNVNLLLQEFNCAELSMLVANKVTFSKFFKDEPFPTKNFDKFVVMKTGDQLRIENIVKHKKDKDINKTPLKEETKIKKQKCRSLLTNQAKVNMMFGKNEKKTKTVKPKPVIVENILLNNAAQIPNPKIHKPNILLNVSTPKVKQNEKCTLKSNKVVINPIVNITKKIDNTPYKPHVVVDNNVNSKDFVLKPNCRLETASNLSKVLRCIKRKNEQEESNPKKTKP